MQITPIMHNPREGQDAMIAMMKNLSIAGAMLFIISTSSSKKQKTH